MATKKIPNKTYAESLARSAKPPQAMASATATNDNWNKNLMSIETLAQSRLVNDPFMKNPSVPNQRVPSPKERPKPTAQKASAATERLMICLTATCPAFLARSVPVSSKPKPSCIVKTSSAAMSTNSVSI